MKPKIDTNSHGGFNQSELNIKHLKPFYGLVLALVFGFDCDFSEQAEGITKSEFCYEFMWEWRGRSGLKPCE